MPASWSDGSTGVRASLLHIVDAAWGGGVDLFDLTFPHLHQRSLSSSRVPALFLLVPPCILHTVPAPTARQGFLGVRKAGRRTDAPSAALTAARRGPDCQVRRGEKEGVEGPEGLLGGGVFRVSETNGAGGVQVSGEEPPAQRGSGDLLRRG